MEQLAVAPVRTSRFALLSVSTHLIAQALIEPSAGVWCEAVDVPADLKINDCWYDDGVVWFVVESETFAPVPEGDEPPEITFHYKTVDL